MAIAPDTRATQNFDYDVCLSFAGEDRAYVAKVAEELRRLGVRVFYDEYEKVDLWGKDLYVHLDDVYRSAARYCILFASKSYASKLWTNHERQSAQARAIEDNSEYVLPARFDDTQIPGVRPTVGYIDLRNTSPSELARLIVKKLGPRPKREYFPPVPDRLYAALGLRGKRRQARAYSDAYEFYWALRRMSIDERRVVTAAFVHGCPGELPDNVHINLDFLRRLTGVSIGRLRRLFGDLSSLGFRCSVRKDDETKGRLGRQEMLVIEWSNMSEVEASGEVAVAVEMLTIATADYCEQCGPKVIEFLDFSNLSSVTEDAHAHAPPQTPD